MSAYNEIYLYDAMKNLAEAFNFAISDCHIKPNEFYDMFLVSGVSKQFEVGNPKYICGMSGTELALNIFEKLGFDFSFFEPQIDYQPSKEYWSGWVLAYFQWTTGKSFEYIGEFINLEEIISMYYPLHEASEEKFVDTLNNIIETSDRKVYLQFLRKKNNYSQLKLAEETGVSLRMIQQYEQGVKDINKASACSLYKISKVLGCKIEDLIND